MIGKKILSINGFKLMAEINALKYRFVISLFIGS